MRPRDPNQLAKLIVDIAVGEVEDTFSEAKKHRDVNLRGRAGGLKGGRARAKKLPKATRSAIASRAANARWKKDEPSKKD